MVNIIQDVVGVDQMTQKDIVIEMLLSNKNAITKYANALAEASTPQFREVLRRHLNAVLDSHEKITDYAIQQAYYYPHDPAKQFSDDLKESFVSLDLETWKENEAEMSDFAGAELNPSRS